MSLLFEILLERVEVFIYISYRVNLIDFFILLCRFFGCKLNTKAVVPTCVHRDKYGKK